MNNKWGCYLEDVTQQCTMQLVVYLVSPDKAVIPVVLLESAHSLIHRANFPTSLLA